MCDASSALSAGTRPSAAYYAPMEAAASSQPAGVYERQVPDERSRLGVPVPRRDKSLSALAHELIAHYASDGTIIDLDEVQVRNGSPSPRPRRPGSVSTRDRLRIGAHAPNRRQTSALGQQPTQPLPVGSPPAAFPWPLPLLFLVLAPPASLR